MAKVFMEVVKTLPTFILFLFLHKKKDMAQTIKTEIPDAMYFDTAHGTKRLSIRRKKLDKLTEKQFEGLMQVLGFMSIWGDKDKITENTFEWEMTNDVSKKTMKAILKKVGIEL